VTFLCTDPTSERQGAASSLMCEVQRAAALAGMPVVLESTVESVGFYERLGFEIRDEFSMMLPAPGASEPTEKYVEKSMVWKGGPAS
jgi:ribosomal protein S18 acetylase RimI-like enzyme